MRPGSERARRGDARPPLGARLLLAATALGVVAFVAFHLLLPGAGRTPLVDTWLYLALCVAAAVVVLWRAQRVEAERATWRLLGVGMLCSAAGEAVYNLAVTTADPEPFPSAADPLYLAFYPLVGLALWGLVRPRSREMTPSLRLDGAVAGLGAAAIAAALSFDVIARAAEGSALQVAVSLAYPIADICLLGAACGALAVLGWRVPRRWWLLLSGLVAFAAGDTIYAYGSATGGYADGNALDGLWPLGTLLLALAAWSPARTIRRREGTTELVAPLAFAAASILLLVGQWLHPISALALVLAGAAVSVALARISLTVGEVRALAESRRLALTDELTGLANRRRLLGELDTALRPGAEIALLLLDLDRFKEVNDALGHDVGDDLLRRVSERLAAALRPGDLLTRLGGDEFAVVLPAADGRAAQQVATRLADQLREAIALEGVTLHVDASIGIAVAPDHGEDPASLMRHADSAMYRAKRDGSGIAAFHPTRDDGSRARLQTLQDLRSGLVEDQLTCHYQPVLDLRTGLVRGVEALARWEHPQQGVLPPGTFLPLAEQAGLMRPLTRRVVDVALRDCARWRAAGHALGVAVNLSAADLLDWDLPAFITGRLDEHGLDAWVLEIEITESTLMADPQRAQRALEALRGQGCSIAVDDYGTGYSSLAYLQRLPADVLKLDRTFIAPLLEDERTHAIVRSTLGLAEALGLRVTAEGIEDAATLDEVRRLGVHRAQGFHIARPMPCDALLDWMRSPVAT